MTKVDVEKLLETHGEVLYTSLLIRKVEEKLLELFAKGMINGTVHTCIGQELIGPCLVPCLDKDDFILSNHRGHGHYISRTGDVKGLIAEVMGRVSGVCKGFGGSQHLLGHQYMSNGIQGGMTPVAAGIAFAFQLQQKNNISVVFIGDGTLGEGVLYETLNICGAWNLPILFVLENNGYAQSTCMKQTFSGDVEKRVEAFGLRYFHADTWNVDALRSEMSAAVDCARSTTACLIEVETYRLKAHSKGDDNRSKAEVEEYCSKDVLTQVLACETSGVTTILSKINTTIEQATEAALASPIFKGCQEPVSQALAVSYTTLTAEQSDKRINDLLYESFLELFTQDDSYVLIGEDIEHKTEWTPIPYGGAFKVSRDLSSRFGDRVRNTPISEAAIVGIGAGLSVAGMKPIVEVMFGDFLSLAFDQIINHASKFHTMFGTEVSVPLIIRTPMGGRRGYGPTHSQSLEKYFFGIPGLSIIALNHRINPDALYRSISEHNNHLTLVIENKVLYTRSLNRSEILGFSIQKSSEVFPTVRIAAKDSLNADITIVCYGGLLEEVEKSIEIAYDEENIIGEVICPTLISPLNIAPIRESVRATGALLVIEEGSSVAALGSEIAGMLAEEGVVLTRFKKLGVNSVIPCSFEAERMLMPNEQSIFSAIQEVLNE